MSRHDSLDLFDFGVLLQALSQSLKVGVLAVRSGDREKFIALERSKILRVHTRRPKAPLEKVLWNQRAIDFYKSLGARPMDDWTVFRVTGEALTRLGSE